MMIFFLRQICWICAYFAFLKYHQFPFVTMLSRIYCHHHRRHQYQLLNFVDFSEKGLIINICIVFKRFKKLLQKNSSDNVNETI